MESKAKKLLKMFGISEIAGKYPAEISGGQKQRTAVARALMNDPLLILADEPTGNLDSRSSNTTFMVTHDSFSASYCDRVIVMKDGKVFTELVRKGGRAGAFFMGIPDTFSLPLASLRYSALIYFMIQ